MFYFLTRGDNMASNGDQYYTTATTFNAMGIQDFPPFNTTVASEFEPKSPGLPHSSSTSSFASYASMFGQNPAAPGAPQGMYSGIQQSSGSPGPGNHSNMYGPSGLANGRSQSSSQIPTPVFGQSQVTSANATSMAGQMFTVPPQTSATSNSMNSQLFPSMPPSTPNNQGTNSNGLVLTSSISPIHSPGISPTGSPLASRRMQSPASLHRQQTIPQKSSAQQQQQQPGNLVQENVGGTTYFYNAEDFKPQNDEHSLELPSYCAYSGMPSHVVHLKLKTSYPQYFAPDELKMDVLNRHVLTMVQVDPSSANAVELPAEVDNYSNLCPLERSNINVKPSIGNLPSTSYKAINNKDGLHYCLRRIHGFRLANTKVNSIMDSWKKLYHPNVITLKEVFTTKCFNDNSIVFVYDYHPGSETITSQHFAHNNNNHHMNNGFHQNHHGSHHNHHSNHGGFSREHGGKNSGSPRGVQQPLLPESLIWTYVVQLASALRAIHAANLAVRCLHENRVVITGKARIRINCVGILDIITPENNGHSNVAAYKQEDLTQLGKIILALACNNTYFTKEMHWNTGVDMVQRNFSPDLKNLVNYLLTVQNRSRNINDVMPMIGARFFTQLDTAQLRSDVIEHEMAKEIENGRLFRIMVKLGSINERPEYSTEPSWAETGDRYMLKLFRDFLFHQVDEAGAAWVDMAHIIQCLNKFDAGVPEKMCLASRDESSLLVVSYAELKRCFQSCFQELVAQAKQTSSFS